MNDPYDPNRMADALVMFLLGAGVGSIITLMLAIHLATGH